MKKRGIAIPVSESVSRTASVNMKVRMMRKEVK